MEREGERERERGRERENVVVPCEYEMHWLSFTMKN